MKKALTFLEIRTFLCKHYNLDAATGAQSAKEFTRGSFLYPRGFNSIEDLKNELTTLENLGDIIRMKNAKNKM